MLKGVGLAYLWRETLVLAAMLVVLLRAGRSAASSRGSPDDARRCASCCGRSSCRSSATRSCCGMMFLMPIVAAAPAVERRDVRGEERAAVRRGPRPHADVARRRCDRLRASRPLRVVGASRRRWLVAERRDARRREPSVILVMPADFERDLVRDAARRGAAHVQRGGRRGRRCHAVLRAADHRGYSRSSAGAARRASTVTTGDRAPSAASRSSRCARAAGTTRSSDYRDYMVPGILVAARDGRRDAAHGDEHRAREGARARSISST